MDTSQTHPDAQCDEQSRVLLLQALAAEQAGDAEAAFGLLKRSLATPRPSALAHHLAAAEYAQRGDIGNAVLHFNHALEAVPELHVARLQLALLWLTQGNPATAADTLQPLLATPETTSIACFARALQALTRDDAAGAIASIEAGLGAGNPNAALVDDMRALRTRLAAALAPPDADLAMMRHDLAIGAYASSEDPQP